MESRDEKNINNKDIKKKAKQISEKIKTTFSQDNSKNKESSETESCEDKIKKLKKEITELKNDKLRTLADFENFRKRKDQELLESRERAIINLIQDILPSIDNFEMSLKMTDNMQMFVKGVEMIHKNLIEILNQNKINAFTPKEGEEFNPVEHDPILVEDKKAKSGVVLSVIKKGYKHGNKVILPARVQVKKEEN